jgi:hypothetical protein
MRHRKLDSCICSISFSVYTIRLATAMVPRIPRHVVDYDNCDPSCT